LPLLIAKPPETVASIVCPLNSMWSALILAVLPLLLTIAAIAAAAVLSLLAASKEEILSDLFAVVTSPAFQFLNLTAIVSEEESPVASTTIAAISSEFYLTVAKMFVPEYPASAC